MAAQHTPWEGVGRRGGRPPPSTITAAEVGQFLSDKRAKVSALTTRWAWLRLAMRCEVRNLAILDGFEGVFGDFGRFSQRAARAPGELRKSMKIGEIRRFLKLENGSCSRLPKIAQNRLKSSRIAENRQIWRCGALYPGWMTPLGGVCASSNVRRHEGIGGDGAPYPGCATPLGSASLRAPTSVLSAKRAVGGDGRRLRRCARSPNDSGFCASSYVRRGGGGGRRNVLPGRCDSARPRLRFLQRTPT